MRAAFFSCVIALAIMITAVVPAGVAYSQSAGTQAANSVVVYYLHTNFRCTNCYNMEKWLKELMDTRFKDQVAAGKVVLRIFNTDEKANQHYLTDYKLYTKSVVVTLVKDGKEVRYENLAKIWDCLKSKDRFQKYVGNEIERFVKEL